jgi:hypothetical protein
VSKISFRILFFISFFEVRSGQILGGFLEKFLILAMIVGDFSKSGTAFVMS